MEKFWATIDRHLGSPEAVEVYRASDVDALRARVAELEAELEAHRVAVEKMNKTSISVELYDDVVKENERLRKIIDPYISVNDEQFREAVAVRLRAAMRKEE